jgi:diadenosine tetraphosphate (Ap4A) HIT family hydrolase
MSAGWLVIGDMQPRPGYCLLLADPLGASLNDLDEPQRVVYCLDVVRIGDALLKVTGADLINYETLGNAAHGLHTHITPRDTNEPSLLRRLPPSLAYPKILARRFDPRKDLPFIEKMREQLDRS